MELKNMSPEELAERFDSLMDAGEDNQWAVAETAFWAGQTHGGITKMARTSRYTANTISRYKRTHEYRANHPTSDDLTFAEMFTLADYSDEKGTALQILATVEGKGINSVRGDKESVKILQDFLTDNPELVKSALKDDETRSAVATAAYKAATEDVVAEAEGVTKEAAKAKVPTGTAAGITAVEIQRFKLEVARSGKEGTLVNRRWLDTFNRLVSDMNAEEIAFIDEQLGLAMMGLSDLRKHVREHMNVGV